LRPAGPPAARLARADAGGLGALRPLPDRGLFLHLLGEAHCLSVRSGLAAHYHYGELLQAGVAIFEYRPTMMHNKVMVVDQVWSTVGSINFVNRSMKKNAEVNIAVYDRAFTIEVEKMVLADLARCDVLTLAEWNKRGPLDRAGELFFWLFSENY
jgi:phosphatidylserine/phosphatidylglycerophosphate/cardiolipin synthase-like enzyme